MNKGKNAIGSLGELNWCFFVMIKGVIVLLGFLLLNYNLCQYDKSDLLSFHESIFVLVKLCFCS